VDLTHYGPNAFVQRRETSVQSSLRESSFREFWSTGDEALLKTALADNFADCAVRSPCAPATIGLRPSRRLGASEKESR
jgi:hypothetical protein